MESSAKSYEAERRSTRIRAQIPLRVTSLDPAIQFSEQCHTLVVNTEGWSAAVASFRTGCSCPAGRTPWWAHSNCIGRELRAARSQILDSGAGARRIRKYLGHSSRSCELGRAAEARYPRCAGSAGYKAGPMALRSVLQPRGISCRPQIAQIDGIDYWAAEPIVLAAPPTGRRALITGSATLRSTGCHRTSWCCGRIQAPGASSPVRHVPYH